MADACARAWEITGEDKWGEATLRAARWLVEANDRGVVLYDFHTGGCCDGLTPSGPNLNQGAESTLAALSALQQAGVTWYLVGPSPEGESIDHTLAWIGQGPPTQDSLRGQGPFGGESL